MGLHYTRIITLKNFGARLPLQILRRRGGTDYARLKTDLHLAQILPYSIAVARPSAFVVVIFCPEYFFLCTTAGGWRAVFSML